MSRLSGNKKSRQSQVPIGKGRGGGGVTKPGGVGIGEDDKLNLTRL